MQESLKMCKLASMKNGMCFFVLLCLLSGNLFAQDQLRVAVPLPGTFPESSLSLPGYPLPPGFTGQADLSPSFSLIRPAYVKENPRGYSYLCRLELEMEEKLPVGIWIKTGDAQAVSTGLKSNAHVRLKLLNF